MKAIIFTGSRVWADFKTVKEVLTKYSKDDIIIHGNAKGLDSIVDYIARKNNMIVISMPAQWDQYHKAAGSKRNEEMLNVLVALGHCGYEISVETFPTKSSRGTLHMMCIAEELGIIVNQHREKLVEIAISTE